MTVDEIAWSPEARRMLAIIARSADAEEARLREIYDRERAKIEAEAAAAIMLALSEVHKGTAEEGEEYARAIVTAIAKGQIPHCKIEY